MDDAREPCLLSHVRASFFVAKNRRVWSWRIEAFSAAFSVAAAYVQNLTCAAGLAVLAIGAKFVARLVASSSRRIFRQAERARRYDFESRALGWPVPAHAHGEVLFSFSKAVETRANQSPVSDEDYYDVKGPPGTARLFGNLAESVFWTEKLMAVMTERRAKQLAAAIVTAIAVLVGLVLVPPSGLFKPESATKSVLIVLRVLSIGVATLIAVDLHGDRGDFRRGAGDCAKIFSALEAALRAAEPSRDEGLRLLVEYNCLVVDLPMIPEAIYARESPRLKRLWKEVAERLPLPHDLTIPHDEAMNRA